MGVWTGFWSETGGKVAQYQKHRLQNWFRGHPGTFLLLWGAKGLTVNAPVAAVRGGRNLARRRKGLEPVKKRKGDESDSTALAVTTTVTERTGPDGATTTTTRTTTTEQSEPEVIDNTGNVINLGQHRKTRRPRNVADPIERGNTVESGRKMLGRTPLGVAFLHLAQEFDVFAPVLSSEATSTFNLVNDAHHAFGMIAVGVDEFADLIAACDLDRKVVNSLYKAMEDAESAAEAMRKARRRIESAYTGQMEQEASSATTVQALPAVAGGTESVGIGRFASQIATEYESFEPEPDAEATSILEWIKCSQAGFALLSASIEELSKRMTQHNMDRRVRDLIGAAADHARSTSTAFRSAKRTMTALYRGQLDQEDTGNGSVRTTPIRRVS